MSRDPFWADFLKLHPRPVRVPAARESIAELDHVEADERASLLVLCASARTAPARFCAQRRLSAMGALNV